MKLTSVKSQLIIFLAGFALYLFFIDKDSAFLSSLGIAVICAAVIESAIKYLGTRKFTLTESSLISGLIVGFVLSSDNPWWVIALASLFAICSKNLIRINKKHLFNPAGFGIFLATILFGATTQWKGTYLWYILVPAGIYFISQIRKTEVILGYGLTALTLFGIQAISQKAPVLNILGYLSYFYIFVMVIEPKTTPTKPLGKLIFGIGLAVLIFILTEIGARFDAELCALLALNLSVPLLNKLQSLPFASA